MHYQEILKEAKQATLIAVSKKQPLENILSVYNAGCRHFGENRVEEALEKMIRAPNDISWHFIGNLQTKKINKVIGHFSLIHSVSTFSLAEEISEKSLRKNCITNILLQSNTSGEASKQGFCPEEWIGYFPRLLKLEGISIQGFMTMAPFTSNEDEIRKCFSKLRELKEFAEKKFDHPMPHLSMGMSNDFHIAVEEGATLLRVGSLIFN